MGLENWGEGPTSRWFRLATAKRRCSRHSGGVMREGPMPDEVLDNLAASGLREVSSAISLLRGEGRIDVHKPEVSCADLLMTYEVRLRRIRSLSSEHARRLAEATSEFVSNLERYRSNDGHWITISGSEEVQFNIFRLERGQILGCLPVVSQLDVSSERWSELWDGDA
jgi:hypothetical protein